MNVARLYVVVVVRALSVVQDRAEAVPRHCNCDLNPTVLLRKSVKTTNVTRAAMHLWVLWNEELIVDASQRTMERAAVGAAGPRGVANSRASTRMTLRRRRRNPKRRGQR